MKSDDHLHHQWVCQFGAAMSLNKNINRSNSKSLTGGRDTSRKGRDGDKKSDKEAGKDNLGLVIKLESDVKRLKCDLQLSRNRENELRDQIVSYMSSKYHLADCHNNLTTQSY